MQQQPAPPIAVIGMAARFPGAVSLTELWQNVLARRVQFRRIPDGRLRLPEYYDPDRSAPDKTYGHQAAVLDGFAFDCLAHRVPRSTYAATDVVHWLTLQTATDAVAHAGVSLADEDRSRIGVVLGNTLTGEETRSNTLRLRWPYVRRVLRRSAAAHGVNGQDLAQLELTMEAVYKSPFADVGEDTLAGGLSNTIAGRVCNRLDLGGGGYVVDGACASSLIAVATAAEHLARGRLDLALAAGVDVSLDPFELVGFAKATALSPDEMRVYDREARGFVPGEGCGVVVLQRLDEAIRDGRQVLAVLQGWGISSDGRGGITKPSVDGQNRALQHAYELAGYPAETLDFVEGHGTGTPVGDAVELRAVARAVSSGGPARRDQVGVTSFKSIVGHCKAAAGIGGFIKAVLAVNQRVIPPTAGCERPNAAFEAEASCLYPIRRGAQRERGQSLRAGVSAMGFGGINCHVTVESAGPPVVLDERHSNHQLLASYQHSEVFPLSAPSLESLGDQLRALRSRADGIAVAELADLAAHCARTVAFDDVRVCVMAENVGELVQRLDDAIALLPTVAGDDEVWRRPGLCMGIGAPPARIGFCLSARGRSASAWAPASPCDIRGQQRRCVPPIAAPGGTGDSPRRRSRTRRSAPRTETRPEPGTRGGPSWRRPKWPSQRCAWRLRCGSIASHSSGSARAWWRATAWESSARSTAPAPSTSTS